MSTEESDFRTGEIPLDELIDVLRSYQSANFEYIEAFLRARLVYETSAIAQTSITVVGDVVQVGSADCNWWLGIHDEERDRVVALQAIHDGGYEDWYVITDEGEKLGELVEIEVGRDV